MIFFQKRFLFLDRCGLYTFPNVKDAGKSTSSEPHIKELSTSSDEEFLANVTKGQLTIQEFDAFVDQVWPTSHYLLFLAAPEKRAR